MNRKSVFIFAALLLTGCATSTNWITFPDAKRGKGVSLDQWLQENPMSNVEGVSIQEISRGESASSHIMRVRKEQPLHLHRWHDAVTVTSSFARQERCQRYQTRE